MPSPSPGRLRPIATPISNASRAVTAVGLNTRVGAWSRVRCGLHRTRPPPWTSMPISPRCARPASEWMRAVFRCTDRCAVSLWTATVCPPTGRACRRACLGARCSTSTVFVGESAGGTPGPITLNRSLRNQEPLPYWFHRLALLFMQAGSTELLRHEALRVTVFSWRRRNACFRTRGTRRWRGTRPKPATVSVPRGHQQSVLGRPRGFPPGRRSS